MSEPNIAEASQAMFDVFSLLKGLLGNTKLNGIGDKDKLKVAVKAVGDWGKTLADVRFDLDDLAIDKMVELLNIFIDSYKKQDSQPLVVGASDHDDDYTQAVAQAFVADLGDAIPEESRQKIIANPKVVKALRRLSREDLIKVLNMQDLLDFLIKWGPVVLQIVLLFI